MKEGNSGYKEIKPKQKVLPKKHGLANTIRAAMATVLIGGISAFACNSSGDAPPEPTPRSATGTPIPPEGTPALVFEAPMPELTPTPEPTSSTESKFGSWFAGNIIVHIDEEGLPVKYVLEGGTEFLLERGNMQRLREIAIQRGEPEIIAITPSTFTPDRATKIIRDLRASSSKFENSSEHPTLSELPKDIVSEEELAERGIKIIQADNTSLHIRQAAFEEGSLLSDFNNTGKELTIVLVSGPTVSKIFMDDPKYDKVQGLIEDEADQQDLIQSTMQREINFTQQAIDIKRKEIQEQEKQTVEKAKAIDDMLILKAVVYGFDNGIFTYEQLLKYMRSNSGPTALNTKNDEGNPVVFLAVGDINLSPFYMQVLYFDPKGDFQMKPAELITPPLPGIFPSASSSPQAGQSHPNPEELGMLTPFQTPTSSSPPPPHLPPGVNLRLKLDPNSDAPVGKLIEAWTQWVKNGDNSGYPFVFSLSKGGYILTKHESSSGSAPSSEL